MKTQLALSACRFMTRNGGHESVALGVHLTALPKHFHILWCSWGFPWHFPQVETKLCSFPHNLASMKSAQSHIYSEATVRLGRRQACQYLNRAFSLTKWWPGGMSHSDECSQITQYSVRPLKFEFHHVKKNYKAEIWEAKLRLAWVSNTELLKSKSYLDKITGISKLKFISWKKITPKWKWFNHKDKEATVMIKQNKQIMHLAKHRPFDLQN